MKIWEYLYVCLQVFGVFLMMILPYILGCVIADCLGI
jgi:hypothetical protein